MPILIPRADDAGSFPEANRAIHRCAVDGWLRNVSFMAPAPWFDEAVRMIGSLPQICCGLHVTFTNEWTRTRWSAFSAGPLPWTEADGRCRADPLTIFHDGVDFARLLVETKAQLAYARSRGLAVRYVDEHMGIGWWHEPGRPERRFADVLAEWCAEEGLIWHQRIAKDQVPGELLMDRAGLLDWCAAPRQTPHLLMTHPCDDTGIAASEQLRLGSDQPGAQARIRAGDRDLLLDRQLQTHLEATGWRLASYEALAG